MRSAPADILLLFTQFFQFLMIYDLYRTARQLHHTLVLEIAQHAGNNLAGIAHELDDFQIQAVTEGREAMGETIVRLRSNGKVYSGRGISTDIVGASIHAYISAINKIVYEEAEA